MAGYSSVNKGRSRKPADPCGFRSATELRVAQQFQDAGVPYTYETDQLGYSLKRKYIPDFKVGDVFVEVKGYWSPADRAKLLAVFKSNPESMLFVALERPGLTISKKSKTTYAQWCNDNGIPWCPIPIPQQFLTAWLNLSRVTSQMSPAPESKASIVITKMKPPRRQLDLFGGSDEAATQDPPALP